MSYLSKYRLEYTFMASNYSSTNSCIENWISVLSKSDGSDLDGLELAELWRLMDDVWDEMGCNNVVLDEGKISSYYQHPVWLLNGLFSERDPDSLHHRQAIADRISHYEASRILDYGGGFGALARLLSQKSPLLKIDIYEPFPTNTALQLCESYPAISFVSQSSTDYDCLVSTDVLEHVPDPLRLFSEMVSCVKLNGYLIVANHFSPSIKCHLPANVHFIYSFNWFASLFGIEKVCLCLDSGATIFKKTREKEVDWRKVRLLESISRFTFPISSFYHRCANYLKLKLRRFIPEFY